MPDAETDPLAGVPLLAALAREERVRLARECGWRRLPARQLVFDKNDPDRDVMFVVSGTVIVTAYSITGKEVAFAELGQGDFFGELSSIDGEGRSASVVTRTACELASLRPGRFRRLVEDHPAIAWELLQRLTRMVRTSNERIMDFTTLNAHQRVYSALLKLARPDPAVRDAWSIYPLPTQSAIASRIGTTRETVARVLGELARGGLVKRKGRSLFIPDLEPLQLLASRLGESNEHEPGTDARGAERT